MKTSRRGAAGFAAIVLAALLLGPAGVAAADGGCGNGNWSAEAFSAQSGDSGLGGTGIGGTGATGDKSGLGGTGLAGDDTGLGGTGADGTGLGGTGIFGVITALGSICVNGTWIHFPGDVEVVFENGVAIGSASLRVGQTVWLLAQEGDEGLETEKIWVLPSQSTPRAATLWLDTRIRTASDLDRLSLEGPIDSWQAAGRFRVRGVMVDAPHQRDLRGHIDSGSSVRVAGPRGRDGVLRADRIHVSVSPPRPPSRQIQRPPRVERPVNVDRPVRPDPVVRPIQTDRVKPAAP